MLLNNTSSRSPYIVYIFNSVCRVFECAPVMFSSKLLLILQKVDSDVVKIKSENL